MNSAARSDLTEHLEHLKEHGNSMSMLFITVRNTSNGLLAGITDEGLSLDYAKAGWMDLSRTSRFKSFCKSRGFALRSVKWGKNRVFRANIGLDVGRAVNVIDECFNVVYGEAGSFGLELRGFGWQPSDDALKATRASSGRCS